MLTLLSVLFYLAVSLGALYLWAFLCRRYFQIDPDVDSIYYVDSVDGWRLALTRLASTTPRTGSCPVLLCPGAGMNARIFLVGETSLATHLRDEGFDVWILDPRGRGSSARPRLWGRHAASWTFDDLVETDLPAAVAEVCRRTGAVQVQLVGFGLGGVAALCFVGGRHDAALQVGAAASIAGPAFFARQERDVPPRLLRALRLLPVRGLVWAFAPFVGRRPLWPFSLLCNADHTDGALLRRALVNGIAPMSGRELAQLARWIEHDELTSADDRRDYRERLARVSVPALLVLGPRDRLAPPTMMQRTSDALVGADKELLFAGREGGMSANYGHLDLLIGRPAHRDLFPRIAAWLAEHGSVAAAARPAVDRGAADPEPADESPAAGAGVAARESAGRFRWHERESAAPERGAVADDDDDGELEGDPLDLVVGDVPNLPKAR